MNKKRVLVSGYIGFNNFGDEAIFYSLSRHLKFLGADVSVLCANPDKVKEKYNVKTYHYKSFFDILKSIFMCDVLFSGGGSLLQNNTSNFSLYYYLFIILLAKLFFKKVIIFAQGIEPINGKFNKVITKLVLKSADLITVRDLKSLNLLKKNNIKAELLSDPVYSILQEIKPNSNKQGLIIQLRRYKGIDDIFLDSLAHTIFSVSKNLKISVLSLQDDYDKEICSNFLNKLYEFGLAAELVSDLTIDKTIDYINSAKYMISTRLHGIITSHALNTKPFALIYDDKVKTISDELNIDNIQIDNFNSSELQTKLNSFFNTQNSTFTYRKFDWEIIDKFIQGL